MSTQTTAETAEQKRARCIRETVAKAPPITAVQRDKLTALLTGGTSLSANQSGQCRDQTPVSTLCLDAAAPSPELRSLPVAS